MDGTDEWINSMRSAHESDKEWAIKRSFLVAHQDKYSKDRLLCLANCFINMEVYGCQYPEPVMHEVRGLAAQLSDIDDYRKERKAQEANRQKFIKESKATKDSSRKRPAEAFVTSNQISTTSSVPLKFTEDISLPLPKKISKFSYPVPIPAMSFEKQTVLAMKNVTKTGKKFPQEKSLHTSIVNPNIIQRVTLNTAIIDNMMKFNFDPSVGPFLVFHHSGTGVQVLNWFQSNINRMNWLATCELEHSKFVLRLRRMGNSTEKNSSSNKKNKYGECVALIQEGSQDDIITKKTAFLVLRYRVLRYMMEKCWIVRMKDITDLSSNITKSHINDGQEEIDKKDKELSTSISKAVAMMKALGWTEGSGLGSQSQGITDPVEVSTTVNRQGIGFSDSTKSLHSCAHTFLTQYIKDGRNDLLIFSKEFSSADRAIIHRVAHKLNLKSSSHGKNENRVLTVRRGGVSNSGQAIKDIVQRGELETDWCYLIPPGKYELLSE